MNNNYYKKYLRYKQKYINLKNKLIGGWTQKYTVNQLVYWNKGIVCRISKVEDDRLTLIPVAEDSEINIIVESDQNLVEPLDN